jgi:hypothetical protein
MCTDTCRRLSRSVSKGIPYVLSHASKQSVPRTLSILSNWSSLSIPRKKCSFRKICHRNQVIEFAGMDTRPVLTIDASMHPTLQISRL